MAPLTGFAVSKGHAQWIVALALRLRVHAGAPFGANAGGSETAYGTSQIVAAVHDDGVGVKESMRVRNIRFRPAKARVSYACAWEDTTFRHRRWEVSGGRASALLDDGDRPVPRSDAESGSPHRAFLEQETPARYSTLRPEVLSRRAVSTFDMPGPGATATTAGR